MKKRYSVGSKVLTVVFTLVCLFWIMPIFEVIINSFKTNDAINTSAFALPNAQTFTGTYAILLLIKEISLVLIPIQTIKERIDSDREPL